MKSITAEEMKLLNKQQARDSATAREKNRLISELMELILKSDLIATVKSTDKDSE